jgi:hypothetical protein
MLAACLAIEFSVQVDSHKPSDSNQDVGFSNYPFERPRFGTQDDVNRSTALPPHLSDKMLACDKVC